LILIASIDSMMPSTAPESVVHDPWSHLQDSQRTTCVTYVCQSSIAAACCNNKLDRNELGINVATVYRWTLRNNGNCLRNCHYQLMELTTQPDALKDEVATTFA
jgi:hypothetical protein